LGDPAAGGEPAVGEDGDPDGGDELPGGVDAEPGTAPGDDVVFGAAAALELDGDASGSAVSADATPLPVAKATPKPNPKAKPPTRDRPLSLSNVPTWPLPITNLRGARPRYFISELLAEAWAKLHRPLVCHSVPKCKSAIARQISSVVKHWQDEFNIDASDNSSTTRDASALRAQLDKTLSLSDFRVRLAALHLEHLTVRRGVRVF
jgi:hypothetical protein